MKHKQQQPVLWLGIVWRPSHESAPIWYEPATWREPIYNVFAETNIEIELTQDTEGQFAAALFSTDRSRAIHKLSPLKNCRLQESDIVTFDWSFKDIRADDLGAVKFPAEFESPELQALLVDIIRRNRAGVSVEWDELRAEHLPAKVVDVQKVVPGAGIWGRDYLGLLGKRLYT